MSIHAMRAAAESTIREQKMIQQGDARGQLVAVSAAELIEFIDAVNRSVRMTCEPDASELRAMLSEPLPKGQPKGND